MKAEAERDRLSGSSDSVGDTASEQEEEDDTSQRSQGQIAESDTTQQLRHEPQQLQQNCQEEKRTRSYHSAGTQRRFRPLTQAICKLEEENSILQAQALKKRRMQPRET
ncbi:hypothetical protein PAMP_024972 [Pampus punctatissimus]